jgi:SAM-dependent methyltransferase
LQVAEEKRNWEAFAEQDPFWAVLSFPEQKYGNWNRDDFYALGEEQISEILAHAEKLGAPERFEAALDFGSGLGRLTRALAGRFDRAIGIDISDTMVANATKLNEDVPNLSFQVNARTDLGTFDDASFDMVNTRLVLQHLPSRDVVENYLAEFLRVLRPEGLLAFQMPNELPLRVRVNPRRNAWRALRRVGLSERTLYWRLGLHPNRMIAIPRADVLAFLESKGAEVLDVVTQRNPELDEFEESVYYVTKPA